MFSFLGKKYSSPVNNIIDKGSIEKKKLTYQEKEVHIVTTKKLAAFWGKK